MTNIHEEALNRVSRILEQFHRKMRILVYLPALLEQSKLQDDTLEIGLLQSHTLRDSCERVAFSDNHLVQNEALATQIEWSKVQELVAEHEDEVLTLTRKYTTESSFKYEKFVSSFESLINVTSWHLKLTPSRKRRRKVELRNAEATISRKQKEVFAVEADSHDEESRNREVVEEIQRKILNLTYLIDEIKAKHDRELGHEIERFQISCRAMVHIDVDDEEGLKNRVEAHETMLDALEQANLEREKNLREDCKELEYRHLAAKDAYDQDLLKLDELKETLENQLSLTNEHLRVLQNQYDIQESLYTELKQERELAIMKAFAETLDNFERNRAARIIQRTWRAYHERISSRRKKKSRRQASKSKRS